MMQTRSIARHSRQNRSPHPAYERHECSSVIAKQTTPRNRLVPAQLGSGGSDFAWQHLTIRPHDNSDVRSRIEHFGVSGHDRGAYPLFLRAEQDEHVDRLDSGDHRRFVSAAVVNDNNEVYEIRQ